MYKLKKNQFFGHLLLSLFVCRSSTIQKVKKNSQKLSGQTRPNSVCSMCREEGT